MAKVEVKAHLLFLHNDRVFAFLNFEETHESQNLKMPRAVAVCLMHLLEKVNA